MFVQVQNDTETQAQQADVTAQQSSAQEFSQIVHFSMETDGVDTASTQLNSVTNADNKENIVDMHEHNGIIRYS